MFNSPSIEDDYYPTIQTRHGKVRLGGTERDPDGIPRDIFAIELPGRAVLYGEWTEKFFANGYDFDIEIVSFGFPPLYSVSGPEGQEALDKDERAAAQAMIEALFAHKPSTSLLPTFRPELKARFQGRVIYRPSWVLQR